jgi:hypothetical protein
MAEQHVNPADEEPLSLSSEDEPLGLVDSPAPTAMRPGGMKTFGGGVKASDQKVSLKRQTNADGTGATRCRVFNSKVTVAALQHMENQINEWMEGSTFEIKHVGHVIGTMEGKTAEQNMIVMVWF